MLECAKGQQCRITTFKELTDANIYKSKEKF